MMASSSLGLVVAGGVIVAGCATVGAENKRPDKASTVRLPAAGASTELVKTRRWSPPVLGGE
jgi:outer membrane murein-binding lipoprotein Lpp